MEVSNEIKEEIRRTQSDLKNAIRVHQLWVARLQEDKDNLLIKRKVMEAEKDIISVSVIQKRVVERLRRELEMYHLRLKLGNKQVNAESDRRYVAQQLREHRLQHRNLAHLKPAPITDLHRSENGDSKPPSEDLSDSESKLSIDTSVPSVGKENGTGSEEVSRDKYPETTVHESRNHFANVLNKVKQSFSINEKVDVAEESSHAGSRSEDASDSDGGAPSLSPTPSPPIPHSPHAVSQEIFLRLLDLVTPQQKEILVKRRNERRKRCANGKRGEFVYDNFDMQPKRKKLNQFPYLQTCTPPQTRSQRLRKEQPAGTSHKEYNSSNGCGSNAPEWLNSIGRKSDSERTPDEDKNCAGCGRNDVPSLLVWCGACGVRLHTGCGTDGRCPSCRCVLPDPAHNTTTDNKHYRGDIADKVVERARLQQRNMELCAELQKLEARAAGLKESLALHNEEKRELLTRQIQTQRNLHKLLHVMSKFKDTAVSAVGSISNSNSPSDSSSKSNDD